MMWCNGTLPPSAWESFEFYKNRADGPVAARSWDRAWEAVQAAFGDTCPQSHARARLPAHMYFR